MDLRHDLRAGLSAALLPAWIVHPLIGVVVMTVWWFTRRAQPRFDAAIVVPAVGAAVVLVAHPTQFGTVAAHLAALAVATVSILAARRAVDTRDASTIGTGAAVTAVALAAAGLYVVASRGTVQVHPATFHPNLTAGLGLVLMGGTALAMGAVRWRNVLGCVGAASGLGIILLSGSRSGVIGLLFAGSAALVMALLRRWMGRRRHHARQIATALVLSAVIAVAALQWAVFDPTILGLSRPPAAIVTSGTTIDTGAGAPWHVRLATIVDPWSASGARIANWRVAWIVIAERPFFGYGFERAIPVYQSRTRSTLMVANDHPHNSTLLVLLQGGTLFATSLGFGAVSFAYRLARRIALGDRTAAHVTATAFGLFAADRFDLLLANPSIALALGTIVVAALARPLPDARDSALERT